MRTQTIDLPGVRLWLARVEEVEDHQWPDLYARMSPDRQERCDRYRRAGDKKRCILAGALVREALSAETGAEPGAITFAQGSGGKPCAVGLDKHFSLSHSACLVMVAVADFPLGADIQRRRPVSEVMTRRLARAGYPGGSDEDFFAWWVRQEAAGKLAGTGLSLRPISEGLRFWDGVLREPDGQYFYCACAKKGFSS